MAIYDNARDTLLAGLSSFWNRLFADRDVLNSLYAVTEEKLAEIYLDILQDVLASSLVTVPIYRERFWELVTLRQDDVLYDPAAARPYSVDLSDTDLTGLSVLYGQLVSPQLTLEDGVEYAYDAATQTLSFTDDPVTLLAGTATRNVAIEPTVYGVGSYARLPAADEVVIEEVLRAGQDGVLTTLSGTQTQFDSATGGFSVYDLGLTLNTQSGTATIIQVITDTRVIVDATLAPGSPLAWTLEDREVFTSYDVGRQLRLYHPTQPETYEDYTIDAVLAANHVRLAGDVSFYAVVTRSLRWAFISRSRVTEYALWAPRAQVDAEDIADRYGALIERIEPSSASYKALVQGIYHYYLLGPSLSRIEAALDVFIGVPVVETDGEVITALDTSGADADRVVTDARTYAVPKGSLDPSLSVGQELTAFQSLTQIFHVADHISDPTWFHNKKIPSELIIDGSVSDRAIDPELYPNTIGSTAKPWYIGAPRVYVGADENGRVLSLTGKDGYIGAAPSELLSRSKKFSPNVGGRELSVWFFHGGEPETHTILTAGLDAATQSRGSLSSASMYLYATPVWGTIDYAEPYLSVSTSNWFWRPEDVGRMVKFTASSLGALVGTFWRITEVATPTDVRVEPWEDAVAVTWAPGNTFVMEPAFFWRVDTREALQHNLGYQVTQQELKYHIAYLTYDVASYPGIPYPRAGDDIRDVLFAGKPAHVYFFLEAGGEVYDSVGLDEPDTTVAPILYDDVAHEYAPLLIDGTWRVGDYLTWSNPDVAWLDVVREEDFGTVTELSDVEGADRVTLALHLTGSSATLSVDVYRWNGAAWALWQTVTLDSAGPAVRVLSTGGDRVAVDTSATAGTYTRVGVGYGALMPTPEIIVSTPAASTSATGQGFGGPILEDANVTFYPFDTWRTVYITVAGVEVAYRIQSVLDPHRVHLVDATTHQPAYLPVGTGYAWRFGAPEQFSTTIAVGQAAFNVTRAGASGEEHLIDWSVQVNFATPPDTGFAFFDASAALAATPVVT